MTDHAKELAEALRAVIIMDEESSNSTWLDSKGRAVLAAYEASLTSPTMTPAEQKAWIAGRDAAAAEMERAAHTMSRLGTRLEEQAYSNGAKSIRALTPPAATALTTEKPE
jgi:hypothetical protein